MGERVLVITGASDGIGAEAARALGGFGRVVVVGRSPQKTRAVAQEIGAAHYAADFASLCEVRRLALALRAAYPAIHVLANNAGGILAARELTI
ncbi:MAG: SDR family NAD(P)-dependent oxidoreductase, partial [Clostridiales bacterium]|nr:SDR family NAD(P)-dependent oxidoreductase [Clostridiales bacterium]